ncbi:ExbD/TolR family protein [Acinetobacter baumannii]|uniref:ExbD/TolR family protein n=1 Tax=Acinetobacter baumannii TaxID=470 RepID=UPI000DECF332|nr:biopolymer transporter ExbD [Acinetobacter baumannii]MBH8504727.1 biopolymer transporter ExbD [Acinetobacter baumannii]RCI23505.1 biopolymer transporter ExbD [Acinetobacter baumannii]RCI31893.1 biopolymer transporter ExbD [Acinetobacter baumannii]
MGMNVGSNNEDDVMLEVNMTPLIDVMLVLIIMFIITIPAPNNAININLPNGTPPPTNEKPPEIIDVRIDAAGKVFWNNQQVSDRKALETLFQGVVAKKDQDQMAEYKNVAMVMATAQRLGVTKIGIVSSN